MRGAADYVRCVGRTPEERAEQRKAARLSLDTSAHAGSEYRRFVRECSVVRARCAAEGRSRAALRPSFLHLIEERFHMIASVLRLAKYMTRRPSTLMGAYAEALGCIYRWSMRVCARREP